MSNNEPQSRNEAILQATLNGTEYTAPPQSRIESLLLQLKAAIEDGGGGGGDTQLAARVAAIEAQLFSTIADVPTNTDSGSMDLYSKDLNTITTSGFYNAMTCTNAPANYCTLVVIGYYLAGYCTQIATDVTTGTLYTRTQTNGTWGAWSGKTNTADLAAVATSGSYEDLSGKPNLATVATSGAYSDLTGKPNLATVATSGRYADLSGKPTIDTAISSSSTNAVQNKAISTALAAKAAAADLTAEETARAAADTKHTAALTEIIDSGAKNKLQITTVLTTETRSGITATYDAAAGTVTLNGTHDGSTAAIFTLYTGNAVDQKTIQAGTYHMSGCPSGGSTSTFRATLSPTISAADTGNGTEFTITEAAPLAYRILVSKPADQEVSFDNVVFRPMICTKAAWDISQEFAPYCPTMPELYAMIQALQSGNSTVSLQSISPAAELTVGAETEVDT